MSVNQGWFKIMAPDGMMGLPVIGMVSQVIRRRERDVRPDLPRPVDDGDDGGGSGITPRYFKAKLFIPN